MSKMMKSLRRVIILPIILSLMAVPVGMVLADWQPGDGHKMHFPQLPDLENGIDIQASTGGDPSTIVADDFLCTESGPITDIHIWGSYADDESLANKNFILLIYADIPVDPPSVMYSRPGALLWFYDTWVYDEILWADGLQEIFWNPATGESTVDTMVWQYNFDIPIDEAFDQVEGTIYWLGVVEMHGDVTFGWKTSVDHWNDYAVWSGDPIGPWNEILNPAGDLYEVDMSFVITTPYSPSPPPEEPGEPVVGIDVYPVNKVSLIAPWIALAISVIAGGIILVRRRKSHS